MYIVLLFFVSIPISVRSYGQNMIGPGQWVVEDIVQCEDNDKYPLKFELFRKKLNRTHDGFTMKMKFEAEFNELYGIEVDIYKNMDGGYKYYQHLEDTSACNFANHYAKENVYKVLALAGVDPPDCPIPEGEYEAKDFIFNYEELTEPSPYGQFEIYAYLLYNAERVSCLKMYTRFEECQDNDDDDDE